MNKKIKVAFVNYCLDVGGIETLILEMSRKLKEDMFEPCVFIFERGGELKKEFINSKISVFEVKKSKGFDWILPIRLSLLMKHHNVDIVHTHNPSSWFSGGIAAKIAGIPNVHTEHTPPNYHKRRWERIERFLAMITNQITTVSKGVAKFMIEKEKISSAKVKVVYNGVDLKKYEMRTDLLRKRKELSLRETDIVVGNISRLVSIKDHTTLLYAFKKVNQLIPRAKLIIAGDGPLRDKLLHIRDELQLQNCVRFLGNRRDIPALLKVFDLFVFSSIPSIKEGLSIAVLEAMVSGLPVVSTGIKDTAESVVNGETGLIVPPKDPKAMSDAICRLLLNRKEAKRMGKRGRENVKQYFTFEKMIKEYKDIYNSACYSRCK